MDIYEHQMMGYDRAITLFSPDGRLLQVEYAKKTVNQGSTALGLTCKEGVVLVADKRIINPLIIPESVEKIFKIDDHIIATAAGIISDARVLVERAQLFAQNHKFSFDQPVDVLLVVKHLSDIKQYFTQSGGLRPFGVSLLIAGYDFSGTSLYETDPTGIYFRYYARAIGEKADAVEKILEKEYKYEMSIDECINFGLKVMKKVLGDNLNPRRLDVAYVDSKRKAVFYNPDKIEGLLKKIKG